MTIIQLRTSLRSELQDITGRVGEIVATSGVREGLVVVQSLHTTGAVTVNENADPDVARDMVAKLDRLVPPAEALYRHAEGNSDSHVKTSLFGPSIALIVSEGRPVLGRWQGIYFCEWDGPRERRVAVQVIGGGSQPSRD